MNDLNLKNIKETIKKRQEQGPIEDTNYLSSILKSKRLELNLTLSDVTKDICSEAFLSKVERNLMDPKNTRVEQLCERLDLDYEKISSLGNNQRIEKILNLFIDNNYNAILEMEEKICDGVYVAEDEIVKAFKYLIRREYKKLYACILGIDTVKDCLSDIELFSLLLIVFEYNLSILRCQKAKEYMELLESFEFKKNKYNLYLKEKKFILNCIIEHNEVNYLFEEIRKSFHLYSTTKQFGLMMYYHETLSTEEAYNYLLQMGKEYVPEFYKEEYAYAKILLLTKLNRNVEAMKMILESNYNKVRFLTLYAYNLFMYKASQPQDLDFKNYKSRLISLMKIGTQNSGDTYHVGFLRLMQYEIDETNSDTICNFIKNSLIKEMYDYCYPLYDEYIKERYCLLLGKLCRYKDAYLFLLQTKIHLKK